MKITAIKTRAEEIFNKANQLPAPERTSFLFNSCDGDQQLLDEVKTLISANENSENSNQIQSGAMTMPIAAEIPFQERVINHYKVKEMLGRGGMGEVYKAIDTTLGRTVAIKTLSPVLVDKPSARQRFLREARAASLLSHPSICTVYEVGQHEDTVFIAMQYIQGETLAHRISNKTLTIEESLAYALDVADALHEAHEHEIIHRDIKPSNVMVNERNVAVVLDFGLAKQIHSEARSDSETPALEDVTTHLGIIGTVPYMSPEQARSGKLDVRSDIFSYGILLYEMLTGKRPFLGRNDIDTLHLILYDEPQLASEINPQVDFELTEILKKSLAKEPMDRYQTLAELKKDLVEVIHRKHYVVRGISTARSGEKFTAENKQMNTSPTRVIDTNEFSKSPKTRNEIAAARGFFSNPLLWIVPFLLIAAVTVWWFTRSTQTEIPPIASMKISEVANWSATPGEVYSIGSFSPDAKRIAYSSTESGMKSIWVKQTSTGNAVQITTDEFNNDNPIWSPDAEEIAFISRRGNHPGIWRIPYFGGTPTELKSLNNSIGGINLRLWSATNKLYYQLKNNLYALDVATQQVRQITNFDEKRSSIPPINISPDEATIAYVNIDEQGNQSLMVMATGNNTGKQIAADPQEIRNIVWHPDGKRILYSAPIDGTFQILVASKNGSKPAQLTFGDRDALALAVSADGSKILFGSSKEESDIWGVEVATAHEFSFASEITSELWPSVSPNSKTVAYQSIKNLSQGDKILDGAILTKTQGKEVQPFELAATGFLPQWSPDGNLIAFLRAIENSDSLFVVKPSGGEEKRIANGLYGIENTVLPYNRFRSSYFSWSPDSKRIAFSSKRASISNIWLSSVENANEVQLTKNAEASLILSCPLWSSDGKRIAYLSEPNRLETGKSDYQIWIYDQESNQEKFIFQSKKNIRLLGWSAEGKELIFTSPNGEKASASPSEIILMKFSVETGITQTSATFSLAYFHNSLLSSDRKTIAFVAHQNDKDDVWLMPVVGGTPKKITNNNNARLYFSSLAWSPDGRAIFFGKQSRYSLLTMLSNFQ